MKKSLTFRVISGVIVASTLLILPATATAAVRELTRPTADVTGTTAVRDLNRPVAGAAPKAARDLNRPAAGAATTAAVRVAGAAAVSGAAAGAGKVAERPGKPAATLPFRLSVPGAVASGFYGSIQGTPQVTIALKVTGRAPCGVLQLTRNGPTDAIEWYTVGALCNAGTATFRTQINRLWGSRSLPSIRLCNGDSLGLAEGVDCDDFVPPRNA
jgi:hypothetical protein